LEAHLLGDSAAFIAVIAIQPPVTKTPLGSTSQSAKLDSENAPRLVCQTLRQLQTYGSSSDAGDVWEGDIRRLRL
jgi:hypothetical protein